VALAGLLSVEAAIYVLAGIVVLVAGRLLLELFSVNRRLLRYILLVILTYSLMTVLFGLIYFLLPENAMRPPFADSPSGVLQALYFSVVTGATVGYGDFQPASADAQILVMAQIFVQVVVLAVGINYVLGRWKSSGGASHSA